MNIIGILALCAAITLAGGRAIANIPVSDAPVVQEAMEIVEDYPEGDSDEDGKIIAALLEQGYFREDVPLSFEDQDYLHTACDKFGVDYHLMLALIERETDFTNSPDGGYCGIDSARWGDLAEEIGATDLNHPYHNFRVGCAALAELYEEYGDWAEALTAYDTGKPGESEYSTDILEGAAKWRS